MQVTQKLDDVAALSRGIVAFSDRCRRVFQRRIGSFMAGWLCGAVKPSCVSGAGADDCILAATLQDATTLAFAASAPHAVIDPGIECVLETLTDDRTFLADFAGTVNADAIAGEERGWRVQATVAVSHPCCL
ncbi:MAG: hypothetical protein ACJAQ9_001646 [Ilumatobacter sp.]